LFALAIVISAVFSTNLTRHAASAVHFFIKYGFKQGILSFAILSLTEAVIATVSALVLFLCILAHLHPKSAGLFGAGILFLLIIVQYKKPKVVEDPETLPSTFSSMGKHYFDELKNAPARYLGYFALFATIAPFSSVSSPFLLFMIPPGIFVGSFLFWCGFQTYIYFHPELLLRRKLNTMQNTSLYLLISFILFGIFNVF